MNFPEDNFDLEQFQKDTAKRRILMFREKNAGLFRLITFVIALASLVAAFFMYDLINILLEQLRVLGIIKY